ncbi:hypothetical protein HBM99_04715 [Providencia heimbachae]|uniref:hypothetical protein n=1 Tax=Providencia heimbachae TaxID=333962 RepID=UPI001419DCE2|nr:hypothetical protein [Providencia heimbachae]NIH21659.1 hypothetical protein [Providencia heimbachae]
MNNVTQIRELLVDLVKSTELPVYDMCSQIICYLGQCPRQRNLTIGGLRAALNKSDSNDDILIQAAFTLAAHPFLVLEVRYKLYDAVIEDVIDELDNPTYLTALSEGYFIDEEGNNVSLEDLNSRVFPYFVNLLQDCEIPEPHIIVRSK